MLSEENPLLSLTYPEQPTWLTLLHMDTNTQADSKPKLFHVSILYPDQDSNFKDPKRRLDVLDLPLNL